MSSRRATPRAPHPMAVVALAMIGLACSTSPAAAMPRFGVPAGWTQIDTAQMDKVRTGVFAEAARQLPAATVAMLRRTKYLEFAFDRRSNAGFMANMNVIGASCPPGGYTDEFAAQVADLWKEKAMKALKAAIVITSAKALRIGDVDCVRVELNSTISGNKLWQLQLHAPGGKRCYIVTYTALASQQAAYGPEIEAAMMATTGLEKPPSRILSATWRGALIGAIGGGLIALLVALFRRKRSSQT